MTEKPDLPYQFIVRIDGEICTKSKPVRKRFQSRLKNNIEDALRSNDLGFKVRGEWSRIFVSASSPEALFILQRIPGIRSVSVVEHTCPPRLKYIVEQGEEKFKDAVNGKRFAVRANRSGTHPFKSMDVNVQLGKKLAQYGKVDLSNPEITVSVEVRPEGALFFCSKILGAGGLPIGVEGKAVSLISGGFDSAVASWRMLQRGCKLDYILCNLAGAAYERTVLSLVKILADQWSYGYRPKLHIIDFEPYVWELREKVSKPYVQVLLKRIMYRIAEKISEEVEAHAVITGEAIGQVSSQTLINMRAIDDVTTMPFLRPLIGTGKVEIIDAARKLGTFSISAATQEYCALVTEKPKTSAKVYFVREEEKKLDLSLIDKLVEERKIIDVRSLNTDELVLPYLYKDSFDEDEFVVIDCREEHQYDAWHYPEAENYPLEELMETYKKLDKEKKYILYCPVGLQSAVIAEKMQSAGFEAYSFKGGTKPLKEFAESQGHF